MRAQVISATGSGKTLMAVEAARRLKARRVLVLVPTLDLLTQMAARMAGRWAGWGHGRGVLPELTYDQTRSALVQAVLINGANALQLQAFRSITSRDWASVRNDLASNIRGLGGRVHESMGRAGPELRTRIPVTTPAGGEAVQDARMIGCDGPGWLLRGVVVGRGATDDEQAEWAYGTFTQTVVEPHVPTSGAWGALILRLPVS
ncbi:DUF3710 domain-containing protein [Streptomyces sp. NPDC056656]|uniref:DUF3710 domain-containing protein n=1 Tax=Streptomyces sp. NPDC056656 TaxID=3345895 RepID=UPI00369BE6F0